nr:zinc-dependent alcohol dehydrogenase family protein [Streptomyces sp. NBC_00899]
MSRTVLFRELGGPEVLRLEDTPAAEPGAGELRIRVEAIGVNRAEALFRSGNYIEAVRSFPARLGAEAAGVVEVVGPGVTGFTAGDPVSTVPAFSQNDYGVYAEQAVVPAAAVLHRPAGLGAVEGAAVWMPYLTAYGALVETSGLRPGDTVLINAASSSVGLAAIHVAERLGATPIALTRTGAKRDALLKEGAAVVVATDTEDVAAAVRAATGGRGADIVLDAVAGPGVRELAGLVAPGGTLLIYGALSGEPTPYPGIELGMPAVSMRTYLVFETTTDPDRLRRAAAFITAGLRGGAFRAIIADTYPLDAVVAAHTVLDRADHLGKLVLTT